MAKKKNLIEIDEVKRNYKMGETVVKALRGVDIDIKAGDFVFIVGPSGSGKCVSPETKIILDSGEMRKIRDVYNDYGTRKKGFSYHPAGLKIFSLNTNGTCPEKVEAIYAGRTNKMVKITTRSGKIVKASGEHPFFTIGENGITETNADLLKRGQFIATARKVSVRGEAQNLPIEKLLVQKAIRMHDSPRIVRRLIRKNGLSDKGVAEYLGVSVMTVNSWKKVNNISLYHLSGLCGLCKESFGRVLESNCWLKSNTSTTFFRLPLKTTPELLEFLGYLIGDGNIDKKGVYFTNADKELLERFAHLSQKLFGIKPAKYKRKNHCKLSIPNVAFAKAISVIFNIPLGKKKKVELPPWLFACTEKELARFIRALFDCDAHVQKSKAEIVLTLSLKELINDLQLLLLRFGIVAKKGGIMKKATNSGMQPREYYYISISGKSEAKKYYREIGFICKHKLRRLKGKIGSGKVDTNVDVLPVSHIIRKARQNLHYSTRRIKRIYGMNLWQVERTKREPSKNFTRKIIGLLNRRMEELEGFKKRLEAGVNYSEASRIAVDIGLPFKHIMKEQKSSTYYYKKCYKKNREHVEKILGKRVRDMLDDALPLMNLLQKLVEAQEDIFWDRIESIGHHRGDFAVYDLTVPSTQNYIANGVFVHNSTLMHIVGALDHPTSGKVKLDGTPLMQMSDFQLSMMRRNRVGFIFQTFNLVLSINALDNVMLPLITEKGISSIELEKRAMKLLKEVGLGHRMYHTPNELSGGERQRVAIARAMINEPEIILADEPTGNLDSTTGDEIFELMRDMNKKRGTTFVIVTHDVEYIRKGDRVYHIKDGVIVETYTQKTGNQLKAKKPKLRSRGKARKRAR